MNKFLLKASLATAVLVAASSSAIAAEVSVGVVNLQKALQEVARGKSAKASLEKEVETRRKEVEKLQAEFQKMGEEFQKKAAVLSEKARMEQGQKIQAKGQQIQEAQQKAQMELQGKEAELTQPIITGLRALIPELSRKRKLDIVMEGSSGILLYATSQTDITEELIRLYDEKNKK
jgi:outer membrane protein